ncbi:CD209 antigen-like protein E [Crotalus tigris]|uniref:CD209 antigen-like protein E n=1 Tax=Crotalus tigris TaxID=88082 RepID=UPI00192F9A04|nr:CD209 antigen-like protein E [Crotalus tigris]
MAPKAPPEPPPPKNFFERFGDYLDSDQGKRRTKILVFLFFVLAVVMTYLYQTEIKKSQSLLDAVASIRQFAVEYDTSLLDKTDLEVLAAVHLLTLELLNWTLKNEELDHELKILTEMLPNWLAFDKNLYFFSTAQKTWQESRDDCMERHTADLYSGTLPEEQGFLDEMVKKNNRDYWIGLRKNTSVSGGLLWLNGDVPDETFWATGQPNDATETCIVAIPPCPLLKCWHDAPCEEKRYFCCKMMPKSIWMP